jgi:hypothetical protein
MGIWGDFGTQRPFRPEFVMPGWELARATDVLHDLADAKAFRAWQLELCLEHPLSRTVLGRTVLAWLREGLGIVGRISSPVAPRFDADTEPLRLHVCGVITPHDRTAVLCAEPGRFGENVEVTPWRALRHLYRVDEAELEARQRPHRGLGG